MKARLGAYLQIAGLSCIVDGIICICIAQTMFTFTSDGSSTPYNLFQYGGLGLIVLGTSLLVGGLVVRYRKAKAGGDYKRYCALALLFVLGGLAIAGLDYPLIKMSLGADPEGMARPLLTILGLIFYLTAHMLIIIGLTLPQFALGIKRLSWAASISAPILFPAVPLVAGIVNALAGGLSGNGARTTDIWVVALVFIVPALLVVVALLLSLKPIDTLESGDLGKPSHTHL